MNSWKLLTALILTLALTNILVFAQGNEPSVDDSGVDDSGVDDSVVDDGAEEPTDEMVEDVGEDDDDHAVEDAVLDAVETVCEAFDGGDVKRVAVSKRGWLKKTWNKVKGGIKKVLPKPRYPWPIIGKRNVETALTNEQDRRSLENFMNAVVSRSTDQDVTVAKRGWFKKVWKNVKTAATRIWKERIVPGIWDRIRNGKRSVDEMDKEVVELSRATEELNSLNSSPDLAVSKRGLWGKVKKIWRKVKPYVRPRPWWSKALGKRNEDFTSDDEDNGDTLAKVEEIKDALDVLNTVVDMAETTEGQE